MKKKLSIALTIILALCTSMIWGAQAASSLNVTTTINGITSIAITADTELPSSFPQDWGITTPQTLADASTKTYCLVIQTNQTIGNITIVANPLKTAQGTAFIRYTVAGLPTASDASVATHASGAPKLLLTQNANIGNRIIGHTFTVTPETEYTDIPNKVYGLSNAPEGEYSGNVTITFEAT